MDFIQLDLIDRDSIANFAKAFSQRYDHLNVLMNNAGVMRPPYTITKNKLELQFDANHIGHFLLTSLLFDRLDCDHETSIVNVSSLAGKWPSADIHFDNLNFEGNYNKGPKFMGLSGMGAYGQSKLANILFTMELKDRLAAADKSIKPVVVHPGASNTDLSRNMSPLIRFLAPILARLINLSTPEQGAQSSIYGALNSQVNAGDFIGTSGKGGAVGPPGRCKLPPKASDRDLCRRLWSLSEDLLGIEFKIQHSFTH